MTKLLRCHHGTNLHTDIYEHLCTSTKDVTKILMYMKKNWICVCKMHWIGLPVTNSIVIRIKIGQCIQLWRSLCVDTNFPTPLPILAPMLCLIPFMPTSFPLHQVSWHFCRWRDCTMFHTWTRLELLCSAMEPLRNVVNHLILVDCHQGPKNNF